MLLQLKTKGNNKFERRYADHVETGKESFTDPYKMLRETLRAA